MGGRGKAGDKVGREGVRGYTWGGRCRGERGWVGAGCEGRDRGGVGEIQDRERRRPLDRSWLQL